MFVDVYNTHCPNVLLLFILVVRFAPELMVLNYSGSKEERQAQRQEITDNINLQHTDWARAKCPFTVMLAHYEVSVSVNEML